jgi:hypothetical protein
VLPFTHGIETELVIIKNNGRWLEGSKMPGVFSQLVQTGFEELKRLLASPSAPPDIASKTKHLEIRNITDPGHNRGEVILVQYELDKQVREYEVFGRDSHGAGATWILEIATPPCATLEELEWWCHALFRAAHVAVDQIPGVTLIATAINPLEEFSVGISFGDHHHIGIKDENAKRAAYDMIRSYIPQLMSISVNSPFSGGRVPEMNLTPKGHIQVKSMVDPFSIRLQENIQQLGPKDEVHYIPHLREGQGIEFFQKATNKATPHDSRFVDMFPFTRFGTIEVRFMDAQLCIADRMAQVLLLQCLAWKGVEMLEAGSEPVEVGQKSIVKNRDNSILKGGLIGLSRDKELAVRDPGFEDVYEGTTATEGKKVQYIYESAQNMVYFVREELERLGIPGTRYLDPALAMLWGGRKGRVTPPVSPAQLQMLIVREHGGDLLELVKYLDGVSDMVAASPSYCPLVEELGSPNAPPFLQPVSMELDMSIPSMVLAGEAVDIGVSLRNLGQAASDLMVRLTVLDDKGRQVLRTDRPIGTPGGDGRSGFEVSLKTDERVGNYNVQMEVFRGTKVLAQSTRSFRAHRFTEKVSHMGPDVYLDLTPGDSIPFIVEVGNGFPHVVEGTARVGLQDVGNGERLGEVEVPVRLPALSKALLAPSEGLGELALAILKGQEHVSTPPLRPRDLKEARRAVIATTVVNDAGKALASSTSLPFLLRTRVSRPAHPALAVTGGISGVEYHEGDELTLSMETTLETGSPPRDVEVLVSSNRLEHPITTLKVESGRGAHNVAFRLPTQFFNPHFGESFLVARETDGRLLAKALLPIVPRPQVRVDVRDLREVSPGKLEGSVSLRSSSDLDGVLLRIRVRADPPTGGDGAPGPGPLLLGEASVGPITVRRGRAIDLVVEVACRTDDAKRPDVATIPVTLEMAVVHRERTVKEAQVSAVLSSPGEALRGDVVARTSLVSADQAGAVLKCSLISNRSIDGIDVALALPDGQRIELGKGLSLGNTPVNLESTLTWERMVPDGTSAAGSDPTLEVLLGHDVVHHERISGAIDALLAGAVERLRLGLVSNPKMLGGEVVLPGAGSSIELRPLVKCAGPLPFDLPLHISARISKGGTMVQQWRSEAISLKTGHAESRFAWAPPEDAEGSYRLDVELCLRGRTLLSRAIDFKLSLPPRP